MILAGDVGGTKTLLGLFDPGPPLRPLRVASFRSASFPSLGAMIEAFHPATPGGIAAAALGVAGPIRGTSAALPNLPWSVEAAPLATLLRIPVALVNDLEACAWGVERLGDGDLATILPGDGAAEGNQAVIAAGTGLGEAVLLRAGGRRSALATEAGHADLAPRTDLEIDLLRWLRERHGRVSWERVLSGPGLANVHAFLSATGRGEEPAHVSEVIRAGAAAAEISAAALDGTSERCALASTSSPASTAPRRATSPSAPSPPAACSSEEASPPRSCRGCAAARSGRRSSTRGGCPLSSPRRRCG
jgi:glucokinase